MFKALHEGVGLWPRSDLPREPMYRLLSHLAAPGEPRLYVQRNKNGGIIQASVSNTNHDPGYPVNQIDLDPALNTWLARRGPWVSIDRETTKGCAASIKAYRINKKGLEAIAQYRARKRYEEETIKLARQILVAERQFMHMIMSACNDN